MNQQTRVPSLPPARAPHRAGNRPPRPQDRPVPAPTPRSTLPVGDRAAHATLTVFGVLCLLAIGAALGIVVYASLLGYLEVPR